MAMIAAPLYSRIDWKMGRAERDGGKREREGGEEGERRDMSGFTPDYG